MKLGITGGNGFLGKHLQLALKREGFFYELLDDYGRLEDAAAVSRFVEGKSVIIHLAGRNKGTDAEVCQANVVGTQILLSAIEEIHAEVTVIFASSTQVYISESYYGLTKKIAESLIKHYSQRSHRRIRGVILRFTNLYGPGGKPFYNSVIATFIRQIHSRSPVTLSGNGGEKRDFLYVADAVTAILKSIEYSQKKRYSTFDICSGKKYSLNSVLGILSRYVSKKPEIIRGNEVQKEWLFRADPAKAEKELGWKPGISIEKGISQIMTYEN